MSISMNTVTDMHCNNKNNKKTRQMLKASWGEPELLQYDCCHLEVNRYLPDDAHHHRPIQQYARCLFAGIQHKEYNVTLKHEDARKQ